MCFLHYWQICDLCAPTTKIPFGEHVYPYIEGSHVRDGGAYNEIDLSFEWI